MPPLPVCALQAAPVLAFSVSSVVILPFFLEESSGALYGRHLLPYTLAVWRAHWFWIAVGVVALDQATKYAIEHFTGEGFTRVILPGLLNLVHRHNPGVAFGLLADAESK